MGRPLRSPRLLKASRSPSQKRLANREGTVPSRYTVPFREKGACVPPPSAASFRSLQAGIYTFVLAEDCHVKSGLCSRFHLDSYQLRESSGFALSLAASSVGWRRFHRVDRSVDAVPMAQGQPPPWLVGKQAFASFPLVPTCCHPVPRWRKRTL